jgi:hypothetical protein
LRRETYGIVVVTVTPLVTVVVATLGIFEMLVVVTDTVRVVVLSVTLMVVERVLVVDRVTVTVETAVP